MAHVRSFPPVEGARARILILGSMPGIASLRAGEYYAHPRNQFWPIVCSLLGADVAPAALPPYAARLRLLVRHRIALWDVLASCEREGSLDSAIEEDTIVANDIAAFLQRQTQVSLVCFNGAKAEAAWRRHVLPGLAGACDLEYRRLPSTSPAHAGMSPARKRAAWRSVLAPGLRSGPAG